ncbi:hypothetical protein EYF80_004897 [Liparis tanakae]|uniref:Uncharacterized protein n=1 Tax=Liparis tanakae TaxID=230148 RepID=A0A4Z2J5T2_9TELE|nr:hypothetical protein EYF80_004897 [Liparis tanakae]
MASEARFSLVEVAQSRMKQNFSVVRSRASAAVMFRNSLKMLLTGGKANRKSRSSAYDRQGALVSHILLLLPWEEQHQGSKRGLKNGGCAGCMKWGLLVQVQTGSGCDRQQVLDRNGIGPPYPGALIDGSSPTVVEKSN